MTNIMHYRPFNELEQAMDDLVKGFFVRPLRFEAPAAAQFRMDVSENDRAYTVHAELPGIRKEDIQVDIDGSEIAISAEAKREKVVKEGEKNLRSERYYGKLYRAFTLGHDIDEAAASAKYADGVLELTLPKKAAANARRIAIQ